MIKITEDMNHDKKEFTSLYNRAFAGRAGADHFYRFLEEIGFFEAPASTKYHLCCPGGLCRHTVNVARNTAKLCATMPDFKNIKATDAVAAALLHDVCKADKYLPNEGGKDPYSYNDNRLLGHGEESVIMAQQYMRLTETEIAAIRWHMGAYMDQDKINTMSKAYDKYPEAMMLHFADMMATHIDELNS